MLQGDIIHLGLAWESSSKKIKSEPDLDWVLVLECDLDCDLDWT